MTMITALGSPAISAMFPMAGAALMIAVALSGTVMLTLARARKLEAAKAMPARRMRRPQKL
jgi:hypothetical protein